jgi:glycosyltransferase involved in cell wall biosynthesis
MAGSVALVVPPGIDDPRRPSGGNTYDRRLRHELAAAGWHVSLREVPGDWPRADAESRHHLAAVLAALPDGAAVLLDGLVALAAPDEVVAAGRRLRTVVLVHMPLGRDDEGVVLRSATGVVTTSDWTRRLVLTRHALDPARVHVAVPGVDPAPLAPGTPGGGSLLCVAAVVPAKGHDLLLTALAGLADRSWRCVCAGALDRDPACVAALRDRIRACGLATRVTLAGSLSGPALRAAYAGADVLVHPSRAETYGMVLTEALARGLPVIASDVGGVPEALGLTTPGECPGLLSPADDAGALAESLRSWLTDEALRQRLRETAARRRAELTGWAVTGGLVARLLGEVAA